MASISVRETKKGKTYYISVSNGRDAHGRQIRSTMTWVPPQGISARDEKKELQRIALDFESKCDQGFTGNDNQTFSEYAAYVLQVKETVGTKRSTIVQDKALLSRIEPSIGHMKLKDIRPQHLNKLYADLSKNGVRLDEQYATCKDGMTVQKLVRTKFGTYEECEAKGGPSPQTICKICKEERVAYATAKKLSRLLGKKTEELFECQKNTSKLSANTIKKHHVLISMILSQAEKEMLIPYNPATKASPPKVLRQDPQYCQIEDVRSIREALKLEPLKWETIVNLMIATGCRRGEIAGLKWDKVDLENGRIRIETALLYNQSGLYEETPKTQSGKRTITIPKEMITLLRTWRTEQNKERLLYGPGWKNTGYVFTAHDGQYIHPDTYTNWLRKFAQKHGLKPVHPHAFRHTQASLLYYSGVDPVTISYRLGHSRVSTTQDIYSHVLDFADEKASEAIANLLKEQPKTPQNIQNK